MQSCVTEELWVETSNVFLEGKLGGEMGWCELGGEVLPELARK